MARFTIQIDEEVHDKLRNLAAAQAKPLRHVIRQAVDAYERAQFLEGLDQDFTLLRTNPEAWADELRERVLWEGTLFDASVDPNQDKS